MADVLFTKMTAAGNDFIVVDNRPGKIPGKARAVKWCDRKFGIGGDGVLLLEKSKKADFKMRIINSDGSEAEMCGNGIRCIAQFAFDKKIVGRCFTVETLAGIIGCEVKAGVVKARMIDPKDFALDFSIPVGGNQMKMHFVNTGVPHAVSFVDKIEAVDVDGVGRLIRTHAHFKPRGANANFVRARGGNAIDVRTYERGVEGETMACGTGSTASALIAATVHGLKSPVAVHTKGGEILKIYFSKDNGRFHDVYLEGPVQTCFEGRVKS